MLKIESMALSDLKKYPGNVKNHTAEQIDEIANSIKEFGFNDPIAIWHNDKGEAEIVEGHGRLMAAEKLGMKKAPVICLDELSDDERRAYAILHNKLQQDTGFDPETILGEMKELDQYNWEEFGFDPIVVANGLSTQDTWEPEKWDDDDTDEVLTAFVVAVRCRGEEEKEEMLKRVGGSTLRRMYRVGELI